VHSGLVVQEAVRNSSVEVVLDHRKHAAGEIAEAVGEVAVVAVTSES